MRLLAVSIVILAGVVMATGGVIAENLPGTRTRNDLDLFGLLLTGFGCVLFTLEWLAGWSVRDGAEPGPAPDRGRS